jgi:hypothetical protein
MGTWEGAPQVPGVDADATTSLQTLSLTFPLNLSIKKKKKHLFPSISLYPLLGPIQLDGIIEIKFTLTSNL